MSFSFAFCSPNDAEEVARLLEDCNLPSEDVRDHLEHFLIARSGEDVAGVVGLELAGSSALLRSLAVTRSYRGQGIARQLYERILAYAHSKGVNTLYLLTLSASDFFVRRGFKRGKREDVPKHIGATREFSALCPVTAELFFKDLRREARYFPKDVLRLTPDVPGAMLWAVALDQTMLTYFEVEPNSRFERHFHSGEQITMVLEGELYFELDERLIRVGAGEVIAIPSEVPHAVLSRSVAVRAVDAWSPVPEQYRTAVAEQT